MKAIVDRIEGTLAVLIVQDDESLRFNIPILLLPPGCREGDILTINIERDPIETAWVKKSVADRIERLKNKK
jgi:hypothetical protein